MNLKKFSLVEWEMTRNMQSLVNVVANVLSFGISLVISFFISPYIVKSLGAEANGFVTLANNFVAYATLLKTALNGVGSRYIIVAYHKGDKEKASKYFSSLFYGNLFLASVLFVVSILCVWKLEHLINISSELVTDVKVLFAFIFADYIFNTVTSVLIVATSVTNKIYLQSIRDIQGYVIRAAVLVVLFSCFSPKVFFLGVATFIPCVVAAGYNIYYKVKLIPEIRVKRKDFSLATIKELISQGIWNSISSLGTMLLTSLDLLIANLLVGEQEMGILSVAKSMPGVVSSFGATISGVFFSAMAIDYAKGDMSVLIKTVKQSTRLCGYVVTIPLAFLLAYGKEFYSLWQPTLDSNKLHILSILTVAGLIFYAGVNSVGSLFTITLHVKERSIVTLLTGVVSLLVTLIMVKFTNLGVYAIAGVSSVVNTISMIAYVVPYGAKYLGQKKTLFLPVIMRSLLSTSALFAVGFLLKCFIPSNTWFTLILSAFVFSVMSLIVNYILMLDAETRKIAIDFVKSKIKK